MNASNNRKINCACHVLTESQLNNMQKYWYNGKFVGHYSTAMVKEFFFLSKWVNYVANLVRLERNKKALQLVLT